AQHGAAPGRKQASLLSRLSAGFGGLRKRRAERRAEQEFASAYDEEPSEEVHLRRVKRGDRVFISGTLWTLIAIVGFIVASLLLAILFPYSRYLPRAEQGLSAALQEPVRIGAIRFSFTPYPNVTLERLAIGAEGKTTAKAVRVIPNPLSLLGAGIEVRDVQLDGLRMDSKGLARASRWFSGDAGGAALQVARIENLVLELGGTESGALRGEAQFAGGRLKKVVLKDAEGSLHVDAVPAAEGFELAISGNGWKLPAKGDLVIDYFDAKGSVDGAVFRIASADLRMFDGIVEGRGAMDWSSGLALIADLQLKRMSVGRLAQAMKSELTLEGEINGPVHVEAQGGGVDKLLDGMKVQSDLLLTRGAVHRFDLVEAVRSTGQHPTRGGYTKFEQMTCNATLESGVLRLDRLRLNSGLLSAVGEMSIDAGGRISGQMAVEMKGSATVVRAPVMLGGSLKEPQLTAPRISR
ncbi:MAG: AsmA family protein, partial [Rhodocyclaceae bacterium]|nr:AsmA family protein [Rhodocyclaceae bacterium]